MTDPVRRSTYEQWVHAHGPELYRCAFRLTGRAQSAEDLVQETFVEAWRSNGKLRDESKARAWLFQILRYRHLHAVRDAKRRMEGQPGKVPLPPDVPADTPPAEFEQQEAVRSALAILDARLRETLVMVVMEGLTAREAAERLGVPLGTVLSRLHRAREQLRTSMVQGRSGPGGGQ